MRSGTSYHLISDCSTKDNYREVVRHHKSKRRILVFESEYILLPPQQRVRIRQYGCVGTPSGAISNYFLFFCMYATKKKYCELVLELNRAMGASVYAIIEYSADNQKRGNISRTEFDMEELKDRIRPKGFPGVIQVMI